MFVHRVRKKRPQFFYSASAYAERCISYDRVCPSDRLTVCHTLVSCQNDSSYDYAVFAGG